MEKIKAEILGMIIKAPKISLFFHEKPDPDTLGCVFGMREFIKDNFHEKEVVIPGLDLLKPDETVSIFRLEEPVPDSDIKGSLAIVMDTADRARIHDQRFALADSLIKIDHHPNVEPFGDICYVRDRVSSACEMVAGILFASRLKVSAQCAFYLYAGMVTDTGGFRFHSVNEKTHMTAARLLRTGMDKSKIYAALGAKTEADTRAIGYILSNYKISRGGIASLTVKSVGNAPFTKDEVKRLINVLSGIEGVEIWSICTYDKPTKTWRASFRSRTVEINKVCERWGGGGHRHAAGVTLKTQKDYERLLDEFGVIVREFLGIKEAGLFTSVT